MATQLTYPCYYLYKDVANLWRWTYYASNGKIIAVSSESYINRSDCIRGIDIVKASYNSNVFEQRAA